MAAPGPTVIVGQMRKYDDMRAALCVLLDGGPVVVEELGRELGWPALRTDDALAALRRAGLAHLEGRLALPSRAAVRFDQLGL